MRPAHRLPEQSGRGWRARQGRACATGAAPTMMRWFRARVSATFSRCGLAANAPARATVSDSTTAAFSMPCAGGRIRITPGEITLQTPETAGSGLGAKPSCMLGDTGDQRVTEAEAVCS